MPPFFGGTNPEKELRDFALVSATITEIVPVANPAKELRDFALASATVTDIVPVAQLDRAPAF